MAAMAIPPAIVRIVGTIDTLIEKIAQAQALLASFGKDTVDGPQIGLTLKTLPARVEAARAEINTLLKGMPAEMAIRLKPGDLAAINTKLIEDLAVAQTVADQRPVYVATKLNTADLAALNARLVTEETMLQSVANAHPVQIPVQLEGAGGAAAALGGTGLLGGILGGAGGAARGALGLITGMMGGGAQAGGGTAGALGSAAGSVFGLGPEALIIGPILGLIGSAVGAAVGAGLTGIGAAGVGAVGMGTDLAGIGQAMNDLKQFRTAVTGLRTAQRQYAAAVKQFGAGSHQAVLALTHMRTASAHVKAVLSSFPKVAQGAIANLSHTITALRHIWDLLTGAAEAKGAHMITEFLHVVEKFVPVIARFASQNMSIITHGLKPFLKWLETTGLAMFTRLEKVFQKGLPTGTSALTHGLRLLFQIVTDVAPTLGHFMKMINTILTKYSTKTQGKVKSFVKTMISDFNAWMGLFQSLFDFGKAVLPLVAHLGKNIIKTVITPMVKTFTAFVKQFAATFKKFFTVHNKEMITGFGSVFKSMMPVIESVLLAFVNLAIAARPLTTTSLKTIASIIQYISTIITALAKLAQHKGSLLTVGKALLGQHPGEHLGTSAWHFLTGGFGYGKRVAKSQIPHATGNTWWNWFGFTIHKFLFGSAAGATLPGMGKLATGRAFTQVSHGQLNQMLAALEYERKHGAHGITTQIKAIQAYLHGGTAGHGMTLASGFLKTQGKAVSAAKKIGTDIHNAVYAALKAPTLGSDFDNHLAGSLSGAAHGVRSAAHRIGYTDIHQAVWKPLEAQKLASTFVDHLRGGLSSGSGKIRTVAHKIGYTDIHQAVWKPLQAQKLASTFVHHLAQALQKDAQELHTVSHKIGFTDIHQAVWRALDAQKLGHTFDTHLAQAILKTQSLVTSAASQLGAHAASAFNRAFASNVKNQTGQSVAKMNNPPIHR